MFSQARSFFTPKPNGNACYAGYQKMRIVSGHQGKNERQQKKSEQDHIQNFLYKTCNQEVSGSFTLSSCKTTAKKSTKKVCYTCKVGFFFATQTYCFFAVFVAVAAWLASHDFIFCFSKLQILTRASLLALAKSIYQQVFKLLHDPIIGFDQVLKSFLIARQFPV